MKPKIYRFSLQNNGGSCFVNRAFIIISYPDLTRPYRKGTRKQNKSNKKKKRKKEKKRKEKKKQSRNSRATRTFQRRLPFSFVFIPEHTSKQ